MVEDVSFVGHERLGHEGLLHGCDALFVFFEGEVCDSLLVENLRVARVLNQCRVEVIDGCLVHVHIEVALGTVLQELDVGRLRTDRLIKVVDSLVEVLKGVVAAAKTIVD